MCSLVLKYVILYSFEEIRTLKFCNFLKNQPVV